jgi:hypothetical protein
MESSEPASHSDRAPTASGRHRSLLVAALLALAALRCLGLGRWGLWIDEAFTLHDSAALLAGVQTKFPLGLYCTAAAQWLFGSDAEWVLRFAPALCGACALPLCVWAFAPALGRSRALAIAGLVGLSSWHLFWSQSARHYTLAQDISLVGCGLALRACASASAWRFALGVAIAAAAGFAHPTAMLVAPALMFAPWLSSLRGARFAWRPPAWCIVLAALVLALALGGWASTVWHKYLDSKSGSSTRQLALTCGYYFTPLLLSCALGGAWLAWRRRSAIDLVALCVCVPAVAALFLASTQAVVSAQYLFVLLPWVALLATAPLFDQGVGARLRGAMMFALAAYGVLDLALYFAMRNGDRPRWSEAYAYVWEQRHDDDMVFGMAWPVGEYYLSPGSKSLRVPEAVVRSSGYLDLAPGQWARRGRRMWFVINREDMLAWQVPERERLLEMLSTQCKLERRFDVPGTPRDLDVDVYLRE